MRSVPSTIDTECRALNEAWERFAADLLGPRGIAVPDTEDALNWDVFLGRSGAAERSPAFVGPSEAPNFGPIRERGITIRQLAELWDMEPLRMHLLHRDETAEQAVGSSCQTLLRAGGPAGEMLCDVFASLPKSSSHWSVRALLQNAAGLAQCGYSFRRWLERECLALGETQFPPRDFRRNVIMTDHDGVAQRFLEQALLLVMGRVFHRASAPVAAHILCDWQLGLWANEKTAVFDLFPYDSRYKQFVEQCGDVPSGEPEFIAWWHAQPGCAGLSPRIAAACMSCSMQES